jgi:hypothetical protein
MNEKERKKARKRGYERKKLEREETYIVVDSSNVGSRSDVLALRMCVDVFGVRVMSSCSN